MANRIKGITVEIGGDTTGLDKSLQQVNSTIRSTEQSLRDVNRLLKLDPTSTQLLSQKQAFLQKEIQETSNKLNVLKQADKQAKVQLENGELGRDKYDALQREIVETENNLDSLKEKLKQVGSVSLTKLSSQFDSTSKKIKKLGDGMSSLGQSLSTKVTLPIAAIGTAGFTAAADLQDAMGATEQIYGKSADRMLRWSGSLKSYYGIAQGQALEYANTMGAMLKNIGGKSDAEAAEMSQKLVALAGDLSAMFGGTTESAVLALTGALKGNNAMLDNYGMGVNEATIKAKALAMGLHDGRGAMSLQAKQAATLALIMEQTADAQGQAGREAAGASGSMKILKTELQNIAATIGNVLLPVITPLMQKISAWLSKFKQLSPESQKLIVTLGLIAAAVGPFLVVLGTCISKIGVAIQGFSKLALFIGKMFASFTSGSSILEGLGAVLGGVSAPILAVVAVIGVLVAAFVTLWNTNEEFRNSVIAVWEKIKETFTGFVNGVKEKLSSLGIDFTSIVEGLKTVWNGLCAILAPLFEGALNLSFTSFKTVLDLITGVLDVFIGLFTGNWSQLWNGVKEIFTAVWNAVKNTFITVFNTLKNVFNVFLSFFGTSWNKLWSSVKNFFMNVWNSIVSFFTNVLNGIKNTATSVWNGIKTAIMSVVNGIKTSISTVFNSVANMVKSVFNGIKNTVVSIWNGIKNAIITPIEAAKNKVKAVIDAITGFFSGIKLSLPHIKLPHFSIKGQFSLTPPSVPYLAIDWYKKAMNKPMLLNGATIFGEKNGRMLGGGEKGPEVIMGLDTLQNMSAGANTQMLSVMNQILAIMDAYFPQFSNQSIVLDTGELVGGIAHRMDSELFKLQTRKTRGW